MQHVGNDMDELFQRAAEKYPLLAGIANWSDIAGKIASGPEAPVAGKGKMKKKLFLIFLLFFMLPSGWLVIYDYKTSRQMPAIVENGINKNKSGPLHKLNISIIKDSGFRKKNIIGAVSGNVQQLTITPDSIQVPDENTGSGISVKKNLMYDLAIIRNDPAIFQRRSRVYLQLNNLLNKTDSPVVANREKLKNLADKRKHSYFGIVAGPDYSRVNSMAFSRTGIVVGLVAGFNINKKISLETGISWNNKYYDSKGTEFSMDKVRTSMAGMTVDNLSGHSTLIEIPVKVKYDLVNKARAGFFVSGGLSAYIMTKERNNYNVTMNGNPKKVTGIYNKNNYRLPAVATVGVGYEYKTGGRTQIRVEPFLKIPLKGVGIGSLPITSVGLQFGIVTRLK